MKSNQCLFVIFITIVLCISCTNEQIDVAQIMLNDLHSKKINNVPKQLEDINDYLPLAIKYTQVFGVDNNVDFLLRYMIDKRTIFKVELVNFYLTTLIISNNKLVFDKIYNSNQKYIYNENQILFDYYHKNDPRFISELSNLKSLKAPTDCGVRQKGADYLSTIYSYCKSFPKLDCQFMIQNYISKKFDFITTEKEKELINSIFLLSSTNPVSQLIVDYYNKDYKRFSSHLEQALLFEKDIFDVNQVDAFYYRMLMIKKMSINLGQKNTLNNFLEKNFKSNEVFYYFYCLNLLSSVGFDKTESNLSILLDMIRDKKSDFAMEVRNQVLSKQTKINEQWVLEIIQFYNDFSEKCLAKQLLNYMFRTIMETNTGKYLVKHFDKISLSDLSYDDKTYIYFDMYLIDVEHQDKWYAKIEKYPFSYPYLMINKGLHNPKFAKGSNLPSLSQKGYDVLRKVRYYLKFDLPHDLDYKLIQSLNNSDRYHIYNEIAEYFNSNGNTLMGIKNHISQFNSWYQEGFANITKEDFMCLYPLYYKDLVLKYSEQNNIEPYLTYGIMREESRFVYNIKSYVGAIGLMQIMPTTGNWIANRMNIKDFNLAIPNDNINFGTYYLNYLKYFTDDLRFRIAGYNAGPARPKKWIKEFEKKSYFAQTELIPIQETRNYVRRVMTSYYIYKYLLEE